MTFATADLMDEHAGTARACLAPLRNLGGRNAFQGPVRTVRVHEDNALVRQILSSPGRGAVLVVDGGGSVRRALAGDNLAWLAIENGWTGIVVNGAVRDTAALARLPLGVLALGVHPQRSEKTGMGEADVPVRFGEVEFTPGAWLYADADGVIVAPVRLD